MAKNGLSVPLSNTSSKFTIQFRFADALFKKFHLRAWSCMRKEIRNILQISLLEKDLQYVDTNTHWWYCASVTLPLSAKHDSPEISRTQEYKIIYENLLKISHSYHRLLIVMQVLQSIVFKLFHIRSFQSIRFRLFIIK